MPAYSRHWSKLLLLAALWLAFVIAYSLSQFDFKSPREPRRSTASAPIAVNSKSTISGGELAELQLSKGLQGSAVDGQMHFDAAQQLVFDVGLWRLFEYLQAADVDRQELVKQVLKQKLGGANLNLALEYLALYTAYHRDLDQVLDGDTPLSDELFAALVDADSASESAVLEQGLNLVARQSALIDSYFTPYPVHTWLAQQLDSSMIKMRQLLVQVDTELSAQEKLIQLEQLQAELSAAQQAAYHQWQQRQILQRELAEAGTNDEARYLARQQSYGAEAAEKLALLDRQQKSWQAKAAAYQQRLAELDLNSEQGRQHRDELLAQFSPGEQRRLKAYLIRQAKEP